MSSTVITRMSDCINSGKPRDALQLGKIHEYDDEVRSDACFWFVRGLANSLIGEDALRFWAHAYDCANWSKQMQGDMYREMALAKLRTGNFKHAEALLARAVSYHSGDLNRLAVAQMVTGRLAFAKREYAQAVDEHLAAEDLWRQADFRDQNWMRTNEFHRFRAMIMNKDFSAALYEHLLRTETLRDRRMQLRLMKRLGKRGLQVSDWLARQPA